MNRSNLFSLSAICAVALATGASAAVYEIEFEATDLYYSFENYGTTYRSPDEPVSGVFTIDSAFDSNIYDETSGITINSDSLGYLIAPAFSFSAGSSLAIGGAADTISSVGFTYGDFFLRIDDLFTDPTFGNFTYRDKCALPPNFCNFYATEVGSVKVTQLDGGPTSPEPELPTIPIPASLPLLAAGLLCMTAFRMKRA